MGRPVFPRLLQPPKSSFFLFGPRGCGKSTWLKSHADSFEKARMVSLLHEGIFQDYLAHPSLFYDQFRSLPARNWVIIDEIQRLPALLNQVHLLIEEHGLRFALTGSSARKLRRAGVNLLAGRAVQRNMYPLTPMEMGDAFDLKFALQYGTLPLVVSADDAKDTLTSYVQMYLKEEIQAEALVKNLGGFSRFLPIAGLFHGQTLNLSSIARDAGVKRPTAQGFFEVLEDTLLATRLPAFESKLRVREKKNPKLYWIDPGIVRATKKDLSPPSVEELGALLEGFIFMLLRFQKDTFGEIDEISYWSPAEAKLTEVDFLLKKGKEFTAIEVKASRTLRPDHLHGLKAISDLKGLKRKTLVYLGNERLTKDGDIEVLPVGQFFDELKSRKI
jgi:uncharacterized protein